jgi:IS5 family transposase
LLGSTRGIILGIVNFRDNPYDGDTLKEPLNQVARLHGYTPDEVVGDRGFRGRPQVNDTPVTTPYSLIKGLPAKLIRKIKHLLKLRISIEPIIGHLKSDHRFSRNYLKGELGDDINPILSASAFNFRKLARMECETLCKSPNSRILKLPQRKKKFPGLPLWRSTSSLF